LTAIVFVHGTGVREEGYSRAFSTFRASVQKRLPEVTVLPCGWGKFLGTELAFGGASIPSYRERPAKDRTKDFESDLKWAIADADPVHDLRFLALTTASEGQRFVIAGTESFAGVLSRKAAGLAHTQPLAGELVERNVLEYFAAAVDRVMDDPVVVRAVSQAHAPAQRSAVVTALGEAIVAATRQEVELGEGEPLPLHGATRRRWVGLVVDGLGGGDLSLLGSAFGLAGKVAMRLGGAWALDRWRGRLSDATQPALGDIVRYLSRGDTLRDAVAEVVGSVDDEVVLVGHSLGGIACLDLLLTRSLPSVRMLMTVGSQGSLLHELDALPGLAVGQDLPTTFPRWVNVYDRRDLLSYLARPIFGDGVVDEELDNEAVMPQSHSAYFDNDAFYDLVATYAGGMARGGG
jgi:pimeloyl-ACP methyl ester carboxylesterase